MRSRLVFPREVLLLEVERWHSEPSCGGRTRIALTKEEARSYTGYECARCERWQPDALAERDIPEWWEELKVTSLDGVRELSTDDGVETGEVVARLSEAWKSLGARDSKEEAEEKERAGDSI
ncbi:MAG: hypothetical protein H7Z38_03855 [Rubrivivax sp.]|nr:hypothetical protein [Pyrinomonadaceae bacterium]